MIEGCRDCDGVVVVYIRNGWLLLGYFQVLEILSPSNHPGPKVIL